MFILLIRLLLLLMIIILIYTAIKYITSPDRKLRSAKRKKKLLLIDDANNFRKNFSITYKGMVFQGEKYIDPLMKDRKVLSIFIWPEQSESIQNLKPEDFREIENEIRKHYPTTDLDWKSPIKELLLSKDEK